MNVNVTIMMADLVDKLIFPVSTINKLKQQCRAYRISKSVRGSHVSGGLFIYVFWYSASIGTRDQNTKKVVRVMQGGTQNRGDGEVRLRLEVD